ncbi:MAG: 30S ribosomal protein S24e [Candidatus Odinarchaeia archaeon]
MAFKLELLSESKNPLLKRKEIEYLITHDLSGTPNRIEVKKKIAAKLNADLENVFIEKVISLAGQNKSKIIVHVYNDRETALKIEPKHIIKRNEIKEVAKEEVKKESKEKKEEKKEESS